MGAGGEALATAAAALAERLLQAAEAARHARRPLHLVPVGGLLVAQVAREALPAAREAQPPAGIHRRTVMLEKSKGKSAHSSRSCHQL